MEEWNSTLLIQIQPRNAKIIKDANTPCNKWTKNNMESDEGMLWGKWGECSKEKAMKNKNAMRIESLMRKLWKKNTNRKKHNEKRAMKSVKNE
jgi:hypothetical protein